MKHYLMSLPMPGGHLHCYLMSNDPDHVEYAMNRTMEVAEGIGSGPTIPVMLSTKLSSKGVRKVRKVLSDCSPEAARTLREADRYHISIWGLPTTAPANTALLELH